MPDTDTSWRCDSCERPMLTGSVFLADPDTWRARGYRRHGAGRKCSSCYQRARRGGVGPSRPQHDREHVIAVWRQMVAAGASCPQIAERLGITPAALKGVVKRARLAGLIEPSDRSKRLKADELASLRRAVGLPVQLPAERAS